MGLEPWACPSIQAFGRTELMDRLCLPCCAVHSKADSTKTFAQYMLAITCCVPTAELSWLSPGTVTSIRFPSSVASECCSMLFSLC